MCTHAMDGVVLRPFRPKTMMLKLPATVRRQSAKMEIGGNCIFFKTPLIVELIISVNAGNAVSGLACVHRISRFDDNNNDVFSSPERVSTVTHAADR